MRAYVWFLFGLCALGYFVAVGHGLQNATGRTAQAPPALVAEPATTVPPPVTEQQDPPTAPPPLASGLASAPQPVLAPPSTPTVPTTTSPAGRLTILLLGIDQRPDQAAAGSDPGRTDTMLVASVDFDAHTASLLSLPRDTSVTIPGYGPQKINAAYTFGEIEHAGNGPSLAKKTVASVLGIPIDRYALVDIHSMEQVVDALGGVWIENPRELVDNQYPTDDYGVTSIDIPAGLQHMDGQTAVEYARTRHPDSDYGRESRQQQVLLALRDQALSPDAITHLPALLPALKDLVRTDLSPTEILQLAQLGHGLTQDQVLRLPPDQSLTPSYVGSDGLWYVRLTPAYLGAARLMITQPRLVEEKAKIVVVNAGAASGTGSRVASLLGSDGLAVGSINTTSRPALTAVQTGPGGLLAAQEIARRLGLAQSTVWIAPDVGSQVQVLLGADFTAPRT